jgi:two-component system, chemotaxis family, sensor kinase CheA
MSKDPYRYFRIEAKELVEQLSRAVLDLEQGVSGKDSVGHLLRLAHTLKGAAHVVKQGEIATLAHQLEDALMPHATGGAIAKPEAGAMLRLVDGIAAQLAALGSDQAKPAEPITPVSTDVFDAIRVELGDMDALLEGVAESGVRLAAFKTRLTEVEHAADLAALVLNQLPTHMTVAGNGRPALSLAKTRGIAEDLHAILAPLHRNLASDVEQVERELAQVRDRASQLRLIPASVLFSPLRRMVRNTAQSLGKQVEFETAGGEHRLDAHVLAAVRDALLQVVRNAVAHGVETPPERAAAAKQATAKVSLLVQRHGNRVAFLCVDDGRGFDVVALRRAAVTRALVLPAEAESLSTEDLFRLLLRGGISTSGVVTELAGRGIGLDVVREMAAKLKADVSMRTDPGRGTTVEITVPVSLLSLGAVLVESGGLRASLPLDAVQQTLSLSENDIAHSPGGDSIVFAGKSVPFLPLARALGQRSPRSRAKPRFTSAVVVRSGAELAAVGVDALLGTTTILLRPIPAFAGVDPIVAGAALDAEGNPELVLDPAALVLAASADGVPVATETPSRIPVVLVIDDSLTTRMLEQSILESAGYEVHLATSAEEAMEKARAHRYDLFVVDVEMPGMDGFEFVARTRSDATLSDVPCILVTSRSSEQDKRRGEEVGARAYVVKSDFDQKQLLQTIRQLVG